MFRSRQKPNPGLISAANSTWCGVSGQTRRRSCWSCCRAWSLRTASPPGVNRCCILSTPLPTTPPPLWMVGCWAFTHLPHAQRYRLAIFSGDFLIANLFSRTSFFFLESCYNRGLPEGGGVSLCSAGLYPVLLRGHSGSQRVRQTVSGATCQTESQPTETAAAGRPEFVDSFHHTSGFKPKLNLPNVGLYYESVL